MESALYKAEKLVSIYEKINPTVRESVRGMIGMMLIHRLQLAGYQISLAQSKVEVTPILGKSTQSQAVQLETFLGRDPMMRENIAYGIIYNSSEFKNYADAHIKTEGDKKNIIPPTRGYLDYFSDATKGKKQTEFSVGDQALVKSRNSISMILNDPKKMAGLIV